MRKKVCIVDYGVGNLTSVAKAFESFGVKPIITSNPEIIEECHGIILPGVGAFPDAIECLEKLQIDKTLRKAAREQKHILGICLGMQLLFEESEEVKKAKGLGLIKGSIKKLDVNLKVPHIGWNNLRKIDNCSILKEVQQGSFVYFVHSFYAEPLEEDTLKAYSYYGIDIPAVVSKGNISGVQFHPEKSGSVGVQILKSFWEDIK